MTLELGPLTIEQSAALVSELSVQQDVLAHADDDEAYLRVAAQCDGNPLFAELMLDVFAEVAPGSQIPPTIHALLGARLDQLPDPERQVLEMAAVIGREFTGPRCTAMAETTAGSAGAEPTGCSTGWSGGASCDRAGAGSFRFDQALLRDTAYSTTPKARREQWHIFLAERLSHAGPTADARHPMTRWPSPTTSRPPACCGRDLRPGDSGLPALASAAADALISRGHARAGPPGPPRRGCPA